MFLLCLLAAGASAATRPNIILILADDLGYGDVGAYDPHSKIPTPHLDRLAAQGMRFTDAHSPSAVCTPTRYALLTGRYAWRTWLKSGVLDGFDPPLIEPGRPTLAGFLKAHGYATACIGKWHLGMTWTTLSGEPVPYRGTGSGEFRAGHEVDFSKAVKGGPLAVGFDSFYGISASLDMSPYVMMRDERVVAPPGERTPERKDLYYNQVAGVQAPGFDLSEVLPRTMAEARAFVVAQARVKKPFFLYLPLSSPHLPITPSAAWRGRTGAGLYADFVAETDAETGALLAVLDDEGIAEDTVVIFTSDNGGLWHEWTPREHDDLAAYEPTARARYNSERGHHSNAGLRGTKADIHEGGHRVPLLVRWPARVRPGATSSALVELNDVFATLAEVLRKPLPADAAEDSFSFLAELTGKRPARNQPPRSFAVHHSLHGAFAYREGRWKLVPTRGSGGFSTPRKVEVGSDEPAGQLYDLAADPAESHNQWAERTDLVHQLAGKLLRIQQGERTRP